MMVHNKFWCNAKITACSELHSVSECQSLNILFPWKKYYFYLSDILCVIVLKMEIQYYYRLINYIVQTTEVLEKYISMKINLLHI